MATARSRRLTGLPRRFALPLAIAAIVLVSAVNYLGVRPGAVVQNVFTLTGYSGVDPTAGVGGIDNNLYPRSRTFTAGAAVRF